MKGKYETTVKERMMDKYPDKGLLGGLFHGKPYPHICKDLKDNFIDKNYPIKKCIKGNYDDTEIKYHYAEHLNSSQTMCISYFKKFFECHEYEELLLEIIKKQAIDIENDHKIVDAVFEHIPHLKEGTNFDFYMKLDNNQQITWEIKFTESEFGTVSLDDKNKDKYIDKYKTIYIPMLEKSVYSIYDNNCIENDFIIKFYKYYQINRNILYAKNKRDYVLFLTPRENTALDDGRAYIEQYADKLNIKHIKNIYWEDLLETTLSVVSKEPELYDYYIKFKEKYFG